MKKGEEDRQVAIGHPQYLLTRSVTVLTFETTN
jgi:hypothetical protein